MTIQRIGGIHTCLKKSTAAFCKLSIITQSLLQTTNKTFHGTLPLRYLYYTYDTHSISWHVLVISSVVTEKSMVIFHLDLDCFYCQVEMKRLSLDRTRPMAVRQWTGLVAVNYPARDRGVKRFMRLQEARRACPEINFVHVPTYGPGDENWQYYLEPDKQTHKVSLDVYRAASQSIFTLIAERFPLLIVQKVQ